MGECSEADYAHAQHLIADFQCENVKDYMKLYFLSDICLLVGVFQMFRNNFLNKYKLDLAYFVSAPQITWNASLKHINKSILLITDPEMYHLIQPNNRGGVPRQFSLRPSE